MVFLEKIQHKVVHLACGNRTLLKGEVGVDLRHRSFPSLDESDPESEFHHMDALDFLILKVHDSSLDLITCIHGPEHFIWTRFLAIIVIGWQKLKHKGTFIVEFPDLLKVVENSAKQVLFTDLLGCESNITIEHRALLTKSRVADAFKEVGYTKVLAGDGRIHNAPNRDTYIEAIK